MTEIHPPIFSYYENDFSHLYDIIKIRRIIPSNLKEFPKNWVYWIKHVEITISVGSKNTNNFHIFDRHIFTSLQREVYHLFYNYQPIISNEDFDCFTLIPYEHLKRHFSYLFGMVDNVDIDYRLEVGIHFEEASKLFISKESLDISKLGIRVEILELSKDNFIWKEHMDNWMNEKLRIQEELKID